MRYVAVCGRSMRGAELRRWRPGLPLGPVGAGVSYRASCGAAEVEGDGVTPVETAMLEGAEHVVLEGVLHQPGRPPRRGCRLRYGGREGRAGRLVNGAGGGSKDEAEGEGMRRSGGNLWYGSRSVVAQWAPLLLGARPVRQAAERVTERERESVTESERESERDRD